MGLERKIIKGKVYIIDRANNLLFTYSEKEKAKKRYAKVKAQMMAENELMQNG